MARKRSPLQMEAVQCSGGYPTQLDRTPMVSGWPQRNGTDSCPIPFQASYLIALTDERCLLLGFIKRDSL
ncbi:hypothetical protein [Rossellomorea marisflavi]|uniref:hypothetical protein n=1 Tax=Rossellomorea TaxID=2837508 RepID=UPI0011E65148|nr:hypothetical protein [Rossellomorea marisflavi]